MHGVKRFCPIIPEFDMLDSKQGKNFSSEKT